jgi:alpha-ketoglutarate-dependent taurine dioxygenase
MKITNIRDDWGIIIELDSPQEFFNYSADYWRNLIYEKKLIFFKAVNFTQEEYAATGLFFGEPWEPDAYKYSQEAAMMVDSTHGPTPISWMSSESQRLSMLSMPWHSDIPNRTFKPFPFRSLWLVSNPNPEVSGKTSWLNLERAIDFLTPEMKAMIPRVRIIQQSWYEPGTDVKEFDLLKIHPVTGVHSLRLNYHNWGQRKDAWICGVKIDGELQADCSFVRDWLEYLEKIPELCYEHVWTTNDIALYDNWPFVHCRSKLVLDPKTEIRKFFRTNIDHLDEQEWATHKAKHFK